MILAFRRQREFWFNKENVSTLAVGPYRPFISSFQSPSPGYHKADFEWSDKSFDHATQLNYACIISSLHVSTAPEELNQFHVAEILKHLSNLVFDVPIPRIDA